MVLGAKIRKIESGARIVLAALLCLIPILVAEIITESRSCSDPNSLSGF
jgi:hypothetical protein